MGTDMRFIRSDMVLKKIGNLGIIQIFVGREKKGKRPFRRLGFCAVRRMLKKRRRKDGRKRAGEGRPLGQAWRRRFFNFRRNMAEQINIYVQKSVMIFYLGINPVF